MRCLCLHEKIEHDPDGPCGHLGCDCQKFNPPIEAESGPEVEDVKPDSEADV